MKLTRVVEIIVLLLVVSVPTAVEAQFSWITNNGAITITGYTGTNPVATIPDTINGLPVIAIGQLAFYQNTNLVSITIGTNVSSIGDSAFDLCTNLTSVTMPNSVVSIGGFAFTQCTSLSSMTIPNGVASIGVEAFQWCSSLTNVMIGNSVTNIGALGFGGCTSLTDVAVPASVTSIGNNAFYECSRLTAITVDTLNPVYSSVDGILFNKSQNTLIRCPGGKVGSYTIPNSVMSIGDNAFDKCFRLTSIIIPDGVASIGFDAFMSCTNVTTVTIGSGVTGIGDYAFFGCAMLTGVYFSGNAPGLGGSSVFLYDSNTTVYYLLGTTGWGSTFGGVPAVLWNPQPQRAGVQDNQFGFTITGTPNIPIVIEATTNLPSSGWTSLQTCTLTNGAIYFSDPAWTNYPDRFYRIRSP